MVNVKKGGGGLLTKHYCDPLLFLMEGDFLEKTLKWHNNVF